MFILALTLIAVVIACCASVYKDHNDSRQASAIQKDRIAIHYENIDQQLAHERMEEIMMEIRRDG